MAIVNVAALESNKNLKFLSTVVIFPPMAVFF